MAKTFNIAPKPRSFLGHQHQKWQASSAIAELVDNSLGEGRGNARSVEIIHDIATRTLIVKDEGRGMNRIGSLFQMGNTSGITPGDIGFYGFGGSLAIIWLAEWVNVATESNQKVMKDSVRWADVFETEDFRDINVSDEWVSGSLLPAGHGTIITMKLLKGRGINTSKIIQDLSQLFAPGLRKGVKITWTTQKKGEDVERYSLSDPYIDTQGSVVAEFNLCLTNSLKCKGRVVFCRDTSHTDSVIRIGFGHREILKTRDCYSNRFGTESYSGVGVSGWIDLEDGWQPYLAATKNDIDDEEIKAELMEAIFFEIKAILSTADESGKDVELDLIASNLQLALNRLSGPTTRAIVKAIKDKDGPVDVDAIPIMPEGIDFSGDPVDWPNDSPQKNRTKTRINPGGENDLEVHAKSIYSIRLVWQRDSQMKGLLCKPQQQATGISVDVNEDHPFVQEALRQKPVNQMALNLMIAYEVATILVEEPKLAENLLSKDIINKMGGHDGSDKIRILERTIIDNISIKNKKVGRPKKSKSEDSLT